MSSDRKKYVMAPELAMQREMAYCKRLESQQRIESQEVSLSRNQKEMPFSSSSSDPTPSSMSSPRVSPSPTQTLDQRIDVRPKMTSPSPTNPFQYRSASTLHQPFNAGPTIASPSPSNPFQYRSSSAISKPVLPPQCPHPSPSPNPSNPFLYRSPSALSKPTLPPRYPIIDHATLLAKSSLASSSSPTNQRRTLGPNQHRPHAQGFLPRPKFSTFGSTPNPYTKSARPISLSSRTSGPMKKPISGPILKRKETPTHTQHNYDKKKSKVYCNVCGVMCSSPSNLEMHFKGQKHLAKVNRDGSRKVNERVKCDLCEIWCMNELCYQQHLNGKNHIKKLHA